MLIVGSDAKIYRRKRRDAKINRQKRRKSLEHGGKCSGGQGIGRESEKQRPLVLTNTASSIRQGGRRRVSSVPHTVFVIVDHDVRVVSDKRGEQRKPAIRPN
jgi:hypothetical protein